MRGSALGIMRLTCAIARVQQQLTRVTEYSFNLQAAIGLKHYTLSDIRQQSIANVGLVCCGTGAAQQRTAHESNAAAACLRTQRAVGTAKRGYQNHRCAEQVIIQILSEQAYAGQDSDKVIHPVVLGRGQPLFSGLRSPIDLRPISATPIGSGVVAAVYQPA
jgi:hypothetical protein